jgi:hypothetical protein
MNAQVIHHHHIAGLQYRVQQMFDVGEENIGVRGLRSSSRDHAAQAHGAQNGQDLPVAARCRLMDASASRGSRVESRHRGSDAALVQENQPLRRDRLDARRELFAALAVGFGVSLGRVQ